MADLTLNEKRLLFALKKTGKTVPDEAAEELGATPDAVLQWAHLCAEKGLVEIEKKLHVVYLRTEEGERYLEEGLPERQVFSSLSGTVPMAELQKHPLSRIAIGWMKKKSWIAIREGMVIPSADAPEGEDERALADLKGPGLSDLKKRGLVTEEETAEYLLSLTGEGQELLEAGLDLTEETGTLTSAQILSGEWEKLRLRRYSLKTPPKTVFPGKVHPYQMVIEEMRRVLLDMGFEEIRGGLVQNSFWNFDALFQPQDHPAREMQDTFFLDESDELPEGWEYVRDMHEHGGPTSSTGWGGVWSQEKARQCVMRTHTTCLTIKHLRDNPEPPVRVFSLDSVYRREAIDATHLPEFAQLEGIMMDEGVSFRHLLGFLREFYNHMGFEEVRFRPGYFPYTEPSVEPEVWVDGLGWVELGGAGIFREEVTSPWGLKHRVLAWGLGASRVAMLRLHLKDIRQLHKSDVDWIRNTPLYGEARRVI